MTQTAHQNRMIVGGVDLFETYGLVSSDNYSLPLPPVVENYIDIPGRDGSLDTSEFSGDVRYGRREQSFVFFKMDFMTQREFEELKTELAGRFHGREFTYELGVDPGYIYTGRISIDPESTFQNDHAFFTMKVKAEPYKSKGTMVYKVNADGGVEINVPAGRKKVVPVFEVSAKTLISQNKNSWYIDPGTYRIRDLLVSGPENILTFNNNLDREYIGRWSDDPEEIWADDPYTIWSVEANNGLPILTSKTWAYDADTTWASNANTTWYDELYPAEPGDDYVYVAFDWKDL